MDEIGYIIGEIESIYIIVDSIFKSNWKIIVEKQEQIIVLKYINTNGNSLPPIIIFKVQNINIVQISINIFLNWYFSISNSEWIFNSYNFEQIYKVFELES